MPAYKCNLCLKKFDRVSNYKRHINRLVPCTNTIKNQEIYLSDDANKNTETIFVINENESDDQNLDSVNPKFSGKFGINPDFSGITAGEINNNPEKIIITKNNFQKNKNNDTLNDTHILDFNNDPETDKINNVTEVETKSENLCPTCNKGYSSVSNLNKHIRKCHPTVEIHPEQKSIIKINSKIAELENEIEKLKNQKPTIIENHNHNQNILQVVCVGQNDNYLDMLTDKWGDYHKALEFIKDCALSEVNGDCRLIKQIYFDPSIKNVPIHYLDKSRGKLEFIDENHQFIVDPKGQKLIKRLANNLQNTYLKGVNYLLTRNLENRGCPNKFLEQYDIQVWNNHIYELSDPQFHKKIINQLEIPCK